MRLAYDGHGANSTLHIAGDTLWLEYFPAAEYRFWTSRALVRTVAGAELQRAYPGVSGKRGDHPQINH